MSFVSTLPRISRPTQMGVLALTLASSLVLAQSSVQVSDPSGGLSGERSAERSALSSAPEPMNEAASLVEPPANSLPVQFPPIAEEYAAPSAPPPPLEPHPQRSVQGPGPAQGLAQTQSSTAANNWGLTRYAQSPSSYSNSPWGGGNWNAPMQGYPSTAPSRTSPWMNNRAQGSMLPNPRAAMPNAPMSFSTSQVTPQAASQAAPQAQSGISEYWKAFALPGDPSKLSEQGQMMFRKLSREARRSGHEFTGRLMKERDALEELYELKARPAPKEVGEIYARIFEVQREMVENRVQMSNDVYDLFQKHMSQPVPVEPSAISPSKEKPSRSGK